MKILVTGANGQLGKEVVRQLLKFQWTVTALSHKDLDIINKDDVSHCFHIEKPDVLVNCAAYTKVDDAETNTDMAFDINHKGPAVVSELCRQNQTTLIHVSTDFVFDGRKQSPYMETDPVNPLGIYGKSKSLGENEILNRLEKFIILRTSWLYGVDGQNFVKTMLKAASKTKLLKVVNDQFGCPTSAIDLGSAITEIVKNIESRQDPMWGIYHYCGDGVVTWHGFAEAIFRIAGLDPLPVVQPISTDQYPAKAKRPHYSALNCKKINKAFGIEAKPWKESLSIVVKKLLTDSDYLFP